MIICKKKSNKVNFNFSSIDKVPILVRPRYNGSFGGLKRSVKSKNALYQNPFK